MGHVADEADSQVWQHTGQCSCHAGSLCVCSITIFMVVQN